MTHVKVDEVLGLMGNVASEVSSDDTVPGWVILLIEFLLDVCGNVLFDVELLQGLVCTVDGILLHLLVHVGVFNDGFPVGSCHSLRYYYDLKMLVVGAYIPSKKIKGPGASDSTAISNY